MKLQRYFRIGLFHILYIPSGEKRTECEAELVESIKRA